MNINLNKFLKMAGFSPDDKNGGRDSTTFKQTGDNEWTFTQTWGKNTDSLILKSFRQKYTRIHLTLHGRNPDDWVRLAECARTLRRMTKTCVQNYDFCIDITYGQQDGKREKLVLYCEMVVDGVYRATERKPRKYDLRSKSRIHASHR